MDELWQRYRGFWTPVLWGVAVFLVGLIAVHVMTDDPEASLVANDALARRLKDRIAPKSKQSDALDATREALADRVKAWARLLDQRHGDEPDVLKAGVEQALAAAIARGKVPADPASFDGDDQAARLATTLYEASVAQRLAQIRTQDPNVSFSRLLVEVLQELDVRANRADVDVADREFGHGSVTNVDRSELPRRLLNLALVATVVDVAIREGVRSIDAVNILPAEVRTQSTGTEPFLSEWPVKVDLTGSPEAMVGVLSALTDPKRPIAFGSATWKQTGKKDGLVKAEMKLYSLRVKADAALGLGAEGGS